MQDGKFANAEVGNFFFKRFRQLFASNRFSSHMNFSHFIICAISLCRLLRLSSISELLELWVTDALLNNGSDHLSHSNLSSTPSVQVSSLLVSKGNFQLIMFLILTNVYCYLLISLSIARTGDQLSWAINSN